MSNDSQKSNSLTPLTPTTNTNMTRKQSVSIGKSLHERLANPQKQTDDGPNTKPNRIALLLDVSGSMKGAKIESLREACISFVNTCNLNDTSLALEPFGEGNPPPNRMALTCFGPLLTTTIQMLDADDSTPMAKAMEYVLKSYSLTRAVLVSDGEPDSQSAAFDTALQFKEASLQCDCVHIGDSSSGENCLKRIAEITGGQYIKFADIQSFARSFKYLTPAYHAMLTSGSISATHLGATEIIK